MENQELWKLFPISLKEKLNSLKEQWNHVQEIRLRVGMPVAVKLGNREWMMDDAGTVTREDIRQFIESVSRHSLYAHEEELRQGFFTVQGGHRIGIVGKVVVEQGTIKTMKYISSINIRMAHQIKGCADLVVPYVMYHGQMCSTLILSPPGCGKTTLLRDLVRLLSERGMNVGVVDERSEIAACYQGIAQNDLGPRTDILDCCPKGAGMMMLIRTMAPQVVAVDEIGGEEDRKALETVMKCGCQILATVHASSIEDIHQKPFFAELWKHRMFERYLVLKKGKMPGEICGIYDADGNRLK